MGIEFKVWLRQVARDPATFAAAVLSLALGIGAVTAAQAIIDRTLFNPLPGLSSPGLVAASQGETRGHVVEYQFHDAEILAEHGEIFSSVAIFGTIWPNPRITAGSLNVSAVTLMVNANSFDVLGIRMAVGRPFIMADHRPGIPAAALLSQAFWQSHFGSDPHALGRQIQIGDVSATVVGIVPGWFQGTDLATHPDVYLPIEVTPQVNPIRYDWLGDRSPMWVRIVARLRHGITRENANAALAAVAMTEAGRKRRSVLQTTLVEIERAAIPRLLWSEFHTLLLLFGLAAISVLLIACLTVGTLLLVKGEQRLHDLAIQ